MLKTWNTPFKPTYYGLESILKLLRSSHNWTNLEHRGDWELITSLLYLGLSRNDLGKFETNDYLRTAISRLGELPTEMCSLSYLLNSKDINTIKCIAEKSGLYTHRVKMRSNTDLMSVHYSRFENLVNTDTKVLEWLSDNSMIDQEVSDIETTRSLKLIILLSIFKLGMQSNLPEFKLGKTEEIKHSALQGLDEEGFVVIENFLSKDEVAHLRAITYELAQKERDLGVAYFYGIKNSMQRVYGLCSKAKSYQTEFLNRRGVFDILEFFFSSSSLHQPFYLSSFQANILFPGAPTQVLHVDSSVPDPLPPWKIRLNINLNLDDFTEDNGSTLVWPGSHLFLRKPTSSDFATPHMKKILAPAGSLIIWTGHLWHQSGANVTSMPRAALLACFCASYLREVSMEENYARVMSPVEWNSTAEDIRLLMGYKHGIKLRENSYFYEPQSSVLPD
jgi:ectoine hydroxylase-related dioxygenase (phytanoyl-CoA dioxygenase family)